MHEHPDFPFEYFAGFDWAKEHHDVVIVDQHGNIVEEFRFEDSAEGWSRFAELARKYPQLAVTVETSQGVVVDRLLTLGLAVFPVHPAAAKRYRERKAPSGVKTDQLDAWALADALRLDGRGWRRLKAEEPLTAELKLLCRDEVALIEQRTALVNQLQQALHEYYPAALEAFDDWTMPGSWHFVIAFPTPHKLVKAGRRRWEKFLRKHGLTSDKTFEDRLEVFARADQFQGVDPVIAAKCRLAVALAHQLLLLKDQLDAYRSRIRELFGQHDDHEIFASLPGQGDKLAPRVLAEIGDDRDRFDDCQGLQCYAGTAPVSFQSGQLHKVRFRRACNKHLRAAVHLWANLSRRYCVWAQVYYQKKRAQGKSHACALRCLAQRWLKILWKMWNDRVDYDEALHTRNQVQHGSWVVQLTNSANP